MGLRELLGALLTPPLAQVGCAHLRPHCVHVCNFKSLQGAGLSTRELVPHRGFTMQRDSR